MTKHQIGVLPISKEQNFEIPSNSNICTIFCSSKFLSYHNLKQNLEFDNSIVVGKLKDGKQYFFPFTTDTSEIIKSHSGSPYASLCINSDEPRDIENAYVSIIDYFKQNYPRKKQIEVRLPPTIIKPLTELHSWILFSLGFKTELLYFGRALIPEKYEGVNRNRRRILSKINQEQVEFFRLLKVSDEAFDLLLKNRIDRHNVTPLHSKIDFENISNLLENSIKVIEAVHLDHLCAVGIIFQDKNFATLQYLAGTECSFQCGIQDLLVNEIIKEYLEANQILLFGTSTEPEYNHSKLNFGLDSYKKSWGLSPYTSSRLIFDL